MDIGSGTGYPSASLSNFAPHPFEIDGVHCNSMEGFLQSLKFSNPDMQKEVCKLVGKQAKFKGKKKNWWKTQTLWWQGVAIKRDSQEYQTLLDRAFEALSKNEGFKNALKNFNQDFSFFIDTYSVMVKFLNEKFEIDVKDFVLY